MALNCLVSDRVGLIFRVVVLMAGDRSQERIPQQLDSLAETPPQEGGGELD